jgi:hypothetical protein
MQCQDGELLSTVIISIGVNCETNNQYLFSFPLPRVPVTGSTTWAPLSNPPQEPSSNPLAHLTAGA